jgi:hypothetical protein
MSSTREDSDSSSTSSDDDDELLRSPKQPLALHNNDPVELYATEHNDKTLVEPLAEVLVSLRNLDWNPANISNQVTWKTNRNQHEARRIGTHLRRMYMLFAEDPARFAPAMAACHGLCQVLQALVLCDQSDDYSLLAHVGGDPMSFMPVRAMKQAMNAMRAYKRISGGRGDRRSSSTLKDKDNNGGAPNSTGRADKQ